MALTFQGNTPKLYAFNRSRNNKNNQYPMTASLMEIVILTATMLSIVQANFDQHV